VLRAIEFRRPVLRSTSDGITVAIDSAGRIVGRLAEREQGVLVVDVWPNPALTPYARTGDVFPWTALLVAGALTGMEIARARRLPTGGEPRS
jgi:apolipoprotein N-acyltransferase